MTKTIAVHTVHEELRKLKAWAQEQQKNMVREAENERVAQEDKPAFRRRATYYEGIVQATHIISGLIGEALHRNKTQEEGVYTIPKKE